MRKLNLYALSLLLVLIAQTAVAIAPAEKCSNPSVFPGAAINVIILPYSTETSTQELGESAQKFTLLMQLEILFSLLKYESVGVVRLVSSPQEMKSGECGPENVLAMLLGQQLGARETLRKGHGLILVWGAFYEEGENLYVQNYVRFLRGGIPGEYVLKVDDSSFIGKLPLQSVPLPPQRITSQDIENIGREFERIAVFHENANESSKGTSFPLDALSMAKEKWTLYVTQVQDDWMYLESRGTGPRGWVHTGGPSSEFLRMKEQKFSFIEGVAGYLRYFVGESDNTFKAPSQTITAADQALEEFERTVISTEQFKKNSDIPALALSSAMRGIMKLHGPQENPQSALEYFNRALSYMTYSADLRNLKLQTELYLAYKASQPNLNAKNIGLDFTKAVAVEPDNETAFSNLTSFYELMLKSGPPPGADPQGTLSKEELSKRLKVLNSVSPPNN
jgi:hypothetical protein